jgi:hypothetical protein
MVSELGLPSTELDKGMQQLDENKDRHSSLEECRQLLEGVTSSLSEVGEAGGTPTRLTAKYESSNS